MEKIVILMMWFFVINGAIIVSKICLWAMRQPDITYVLTGWFIMTATWSFLIGEGIKLYKKVKK
jgi:hypothetical protein